MAKRKTAQSSSRVLDRLLARHGELIPPSVLWRVLGYPSASAARTARQRGAFPIAIFHIRGRKGFWARTADVAEWMERLGSVPDTVRIDPPANDLAVRGHLPAPDGASLKEEDS